MSQHDYVIANGTGAAVRSDLNNALAAIVSQNSGATAPATTYAYQWWADTTTGLLKLRNAANNAWITLFQLDGEWSTLAVENGSAAAPSIYFKDSGTDTGIYSPGADQVAVATNGTGRLFVDASGRVGIGTSSPNVPFQVIGSATVTDAVIRATNSGATQSMALMSGGLRMDGGAPIQIYQGGTEVARIDTSGRLGIGTTSPDTLLTCATSDNTIAARFKGANGIFRVLPFETGLGVKVTALNGNESAYEHLAIQGASHSFITGTSERARIDSSGRLLVGTSSGSGRLEIAGATDAAPVVIKGASTEGAYVDFYNNAASSNKFRIGQGYSTGSDNVAFLSNRANADMVFQTNSAERMRIVSTGQVLIGGNTTNPHTNADGVSISKAGGILVGVTSTHAAIFARHDTDGECVRFQRNNTDVGSIDVTTTATSYNTSSDYRLKENVAAVTDGITRLHQLKPCRFNFTVDPNTTVDGFLAHEAQAVVPECVTGEKDAVDDDGNPIYQGIDHSKLVPLLTAALQEAIGEIESLKSRLTAAGI